MIAKVLLAVFIAVALMDQSSAYNLPDWMSKCKKSQPSEGLPDLRASMICIATRSMLFNAKGEFDLKKMNEITLSYSKQKEHAIVMAEFKKCSNKATGKTSEEKINNFRDCINGEKHQE